MAVSSAAQQAELRAFEKVKKLLKGAQVTSAPAGFETSFPDFGFRIQVGKKTVDILIEYKADAKAQMGSMRDWIFDGRSFKTPDLRNEEKKDLIEIMNQSSEAVQNAKRLLKDFKTYADPKINLIYSGMMTIEKDQKIRRSKLEAFAAGTKNYQIAKIANTTLGNGIISHYKKKFKDAVSSDANYSVLLMMIGNEIWFVDEKGTLAPEEQKGFLKMLNITNIPVMRNLSANLEVRIQPRGLSAPGKPVSVDVMSSFRLNGKPGSGATIIN